MALKVGIIGCGRPGRGQARLHAAGYKKIGAELVALADVVEENARGFQKEHGNGNEHIYTDYREMLKNETLDVVSICTWPHLHAPMVLDAAQAKVRAIHCEKPVAPSWGEAKRMVEMCEQRGVQLTFNHQRRFGEPFQRARELLKSGEIGDLIRLEGACDNLFDWGTHWFDMMFFYNDETPAEWVLGQMEWRGSRTVFGVPIERMGLSHVGFANGVQGMLVTGAAQKGWGASNRLVGTEGVIEVGVFDRETKHETTSLRLMNAGSNGWRQIQTSENLHSDEAVARGIADLVEALQSGREPELSGRRALRTTEVIMATYESSRRRGRVNLPLDVEESPLLAVLAENGAVPEGTLAGV
ncbi:MAG TPA: Gfo/Idh/MocA family oxidoreductase [Abditibacteriaceae bacterium]|nr:Gfo/Idh/MocA family oxidoreductase [Abditibacteriaceae bacterium]